MADVEEIRSAVRESYTRAVTRPSGCCGREMKGVAVQEAGYRPEELASLPDDAVHNAFGCGNPLAFAEVKPGEVVLDLGSGAGIDLLLAAERVGASGKVIGVDMTPEMVERARRNVAAAGFADRVEIRQGLIEALPVADASVDWVISNCVINLSPEKQRVFGEIARVLKPGGRISISDIVAEELPAELRRDLDAHCACLAGAISERAYLEGLSAAGLCEVAITERLVYGPEQIRELVASELEEASCCGGSARMEELFARYGAVVAGKVASVRVSARRA